MGIDPLTTAAALATLGGISNYLYYKGSKAMAKSAYRYARSSAKRRRPIKRRLTRPTKFAKKTALTKKRRYSRYRSNRLSLLTKRVNNLTKSVSSDQAKHTHRRRDVLGVAGEIRQASNTVADGTTTTLLEQVMAFLRYYDPATPGTLVTADAATGTYSRQIHFARISEKLTVRNNYQVPVMVKVYSCTPKVDTNSDPATFFSAGVTDQGASLSTSSPLLSPTDIHNVTRNWNMKLAINQRLEPGREVHAYKYHKAFDYDPAVYDSHALQYQKKFGGHVFYFRITGCLGHDTAASEWTTIKGAIDTVLDRTFVMTYDAGVNLDDYSVDDNSSASFTNGGVVSNKPMADNQAYSQA